MSLRPAAGNDVVRWPDGTWCYRDDLPEYTWMSDDYEVIPHESPEWDLIVGLHDIPTNHQGEKACQQ